MTTLTSRNGVLEFGIGRPLCLINDQLRVYDQSPAILHELKHGRFDSLLALARLGRDRGTHMVGILIGHHELDEATLLPALARAVHDEIGWPISLDTRDPAALDEALAALHPYKAMINSVSAEANCLDRLPRTVDERVAEAEIILAACDYYGIPREDVVLDAICLASSAESGSMQVTVQTLRTFHERLGATTILGIGNAGFGMPDPTRIDLAYLIAAVLNGLDAALVNPTTPGLLAGAQAINFLCGRDEDWVRALITGI
jgi:5-methyltetrahydrofolate--homocysteine methyltransferase